MRALMTALGRGVLHLGVSGLYVLAQPLQWAGLVYLGYVQIYEPMALAPGARDGAGLLFVLGGVVLGALMLTAVLALLEAWLLRVLLPTWEPPIDDD